MKLSTLLLNIDEDSMVILYEDGIMMYSGPAGLIKLKATRGQKVKKIRPCMFLAPREAGIEIWATSES